MTQSLDRLSPGLQQLLGRHARLERELAAAFSLLPWPAALIDRLVNELSETERAIGAAAPVDEQCGEQMPGFTMLPGSSR